MQLTHILKMKMVRIIFLGLFFAFLPINSWSSEKIVEHKIQIKGHKFIPDRLEVTANQKIKLIIENLDSTIEEFESHDLSREKLVGSGKSVSIFVGPLKVGSYGFYGDFHPKTAQGILVVK